jgi:hypothetical protein
LVRYDLERFPERVLSDCCPPFVAARQERKRTDIERERSVEGAASVDAWWATYLQLGSSAYGLVTFGPS